MQWEQSECEKKTRHRPKFWHKAGWKELAYQETLLSTPVGLDFVNKSTEKYRQLPWLDESQENDHHRPIPMFSPNRFGLSLSLAAQAIAVSLKNLGRIACWWDLIGGCRPGLYSWWGLIADVLGGVAAGASLKGVTDTLFHK